MRKLLLLSACLLAMPAAAQRSDECALTPLQNLIVNARGAEEIRQLVDRGVSFDEQVRCGGSLMQLAIRRGNPDILEAILRQDRRRANVVVNTDVFPIPGAPKQIPLILFAAYYAPNATMVELLLAADGEVFKKTDEFGRNVLWYLNKNPVLRNTDLEDKLNEGLLYGTAVAADTNSDTRQAGKKEANKEIDLQDKTPKKENAESVGKWLVDE